MKLGREECRKKIQAFTSEFNLKEGSHSSQATFLRSEQVLNKSWASGWNTEKMVVSFTEICMSFFWKKKNSLVNMKSDGIKRSTTDYPSE